MNTLKFRFIAGSVIIFLFAGCDNSTTNESHETNNPIHHDTIIKTKLEKSDAQLIAEGATAALDLAKKGLANKRAKDSLRIVSRTEYWVYVVGSPFTDLDRAAEAWRQIEDLYGASLFEQNDQYYLIKLGNSKQELMDSLGSFKTHLKQTELKNQVVEIQNLTTKCGKKEEIVFSQSRRVKRKYEEMPCYLCE
jgi:hypothetical protein